MNIEVSKATGAVLDWLVAKCEGKTIHSLPAINYAFLVDNAVPFKPSTDWSQGGIIIEREVIHTWTDYKDAAWLGHPNEFWVAATSSDMSPLLWGSTPLVAAMRCYVVTKLGEEVEVPEELL